MTNENPNPTSGKPASAPVVKNAKESKAKLKTKETPAEKTPAISPVPAKEKTEGKSNWLDDSLSLFGW